LAVIRTAAAADGGGVDVVVVVIAADIAVTCWVQLAGGLGLGAC
jgi:hypothetical protein